METLKLKNLSIETVNLTVPPLADLLKTLSKGLANNYADVEVKIVHCPDLTLPPFNLAAKGLCGNGSFVQVGDPAYVVPTTLREKLYNFRDVPKVLNMNSPAFIIGAGAGNCNLYRTIPEMFMNLIVTENSVENFSKIALSKDGTVEGITLENVDYTESQFNSLGTLYVSRGLPGNVIQISCKRRIGTEDFPSSITSSLKAEFHDPIALGIVFNMLRGEAQHHVAPSLAKDVRNSTEIKKWLLWPKLSAPFTSVGTILTSNPPGLNLVTQHFHSCNNRDRAGGHYHFDVIPETVEYLAYVSPAEKLCSIDAAVNPISLFNYDATSKAN